MTILKLTEEEKKVLTELHYMRSVKLDKIGRITPIGRKRYVYYDSLGIRRETNRDGILKLMRKGGL
jgi:hypothetical protein